MAKMRYVGEEPREVSLMPAGVLRKLEPDQLFDVPDAYWESYACQPALYEPQDDNPNQETVKAVLDRVGDDPQAARAALEAENRNSNPRTTLVAELERRAAVQTED